MENRTTIKDEIMEIGINDPDYPALLKEITDPPKRLYVRGNLDLVGREVVAVIGSRKPTSYGIEVTRHILKGIGSKVAIVSGLAYGIDALAHEITLEQGGYTVAVLGTGVDDDSIYPKENLELARKIVALGGALISEYPPGTKPLKHHFPMRNRIIAGLSQKLVVMEAGERSGTLITAQLALDYNRDVMAVPGSIFSEGSPGVNYLVSQGARIVTSSTDIWPERKLA
jgi:DNA processing protein